MKDRISVEQAHRLINCGCVLLVTSAYQEKNNVMTLAWQTPISSESLLLGIAVNSTHYTAELINKSGEFALNVPGIEILEQVSECGRVSGRSVAKFEEINITPEPAQMLSAPLIKECLGHVECRVVEQYDLGDHTLYVGKVIAASARSDLFTSGRWNSSAVLVHHLGGSEYYASGDRKTV